MIPVFIIGVIIGIAISYALSIIKTTSYVRSKPHLFTRTQIIDALKNFQLRCHQLTSDALPPENLEDLCDISEITRIYKPKY